jgi:hypothetical protein
MGGLLGLSGGSTSEHTDVVVDVIDLVSNSVNGVDSTGGGSLDYDENYWSRRRG